ncbi:MAG: hypothetical protein NVS3B26_22840 [Mycobacteriales bacterium]
MSAPPVNRPDALRSPTFAYWPDSRRLPPAPPVAWSACRLVRLSPGPPVAWSACRLVRLSPGPRAAWSAPPDPGRLPCAGRAPAGWPVSDVQHALSPAGS